MRLLLVLTVIVLLSLVTTPDSILTLAKTITITNTHSVSETVTIKTNALVTPTHSVSDVVITKTNALITPIHSVSDIVITRTNALITPTHTVREHVVLSRTQTTIPLSYTINVNELLTIPKVLNITNTYTVQEQRQEQTRTTTTAINPFSFQTPKNCLLLEPEQLSSSLFKYVVNGKFVIFFNSSEYINIVIYPYGYSSSNYQVVCESLYYCGFRSYFQALYDNVTKTLLFSVNTINVGITNKTSTDTYSFLLELEENVRDFSGIGSLLVWSVKVTTFDNKGKVVVSSDLPVWSAFYQRETDKKPYPIEIYTTNNNVSVWDCGSTVQLLLCPSDNPIVCALWSFARLIYNIMPEPIKALFNVISGLGNVLLTLVSFVTNPQLLNVVITFIPLVFFLLLSILILQGGIAGLIEFFFTVFEYLKKIGEFIINVFKSIIP